MTRAKKRLLVQKRQERQELRQKRKLLLAQAAHTRWRKSHILLCRHYPAGDCCTLCHAEVVMEDMITLPKDKHAYLCCGKIKANWKDLGYLGSPIYTMEKKQKRQCL